MPLVQWVVKLTARAMHAPVGNLDYAPMRTAQFAERGPLIEAELPRRRRVGTAGNDPSLTWTVLGCCSAPGSSSAGPSTVAICAVIGGNARKQGVGR